MGLLALFAKRFVAGEKVEDAITAIKRLNTTGIQTTVDYLGENVTTKEEATAAANAYLVLLDEFKRNDLQSHVSIKLTMMGLEIGSEFCLNNIKRIIQKAEEIDSFVRIDMEGSAVTQTTLDIFYRLAEAHQNVGIVIQSYLYRSEKDIQDLVAKNAQVRLCKGAYKEPATVAFPSKDEVNANYLKLARMLLDGNARVAIATHDRKMIEPLREYIAENNIPKSRYEWQMLFGIERKLQETLAREGDDVRVYVPYGTDWLGYFSRRMMERKENFLFALKHFVRG